MKAKTFISIASALSLVLAASCSKTLENTYSTQETKIESIVSSLSSKDTTVTVDYINGSVRVTVVHGEGEELQENGAVSFYYAGYYVNGTSLSKSNMFTTNYDTFASSSSWSVTDSTLLQIKTLDLSQEHVVKGLEQGLIGVRGGDECYVLFSGKYGFGEKSHGNVPKNSALAYHLWIKSVTN